MKDRRTEGRGYRDVEGILAPLGAALGVPGFVAEIVLGFGEEGPMGFIRERGWREKRDGKESYITTCAHNSPVGREDYHTVAIDLYLTFLSRTNPNPSPLFSIPILTLILTLTSYENTGKRSMGGVKGSLVREGQVGPLLELEELLRLCIEHILVLLVHEGQLAIAATLQASHLLLTLMSTWSDLHPRGIFDVGNLC